MAIPFAMPRNEHAGLDLEQQIIRLLAMVSEIRMLLSLNNNNNNARDDGAASRRSARGVGGTPARLPIISLSLDAGRVSMIVGATPAGGTTVTTVTTTTTTTTTHNRAGDRDTNDARQPAHDVDDVAGAPRTDATADAKRVAASLREMADKLSLQPSADEVGDNCRGVNANADDDDEGGGSDVPDSRPINPPAPAQPRRAAEPPQPPQASGTAPSTSSSPASNSHHTVTTVTTLTTTRYHIQPSPSNSDNVTPAARGGSVLDKLSAVPPVSLVMVPFAVIAGWHWFKGR